MRLLDEVSKINSIFIDTAPIIYYIEAHHRFGPLVKEIVNAVQTKKIIAVTSVLTLSVVISKPIEAGNEILVKKFINFLKYGKNFNLIEISESIAEQAGRLRGKYTFLKTIDAVQISTAIETDTDAFLTNDKQLKQINEIKILVLSDY